MEIKVGKTSGFCYGVKNAVENAEKELLKYNKPIYCLGELVHNKIVVGDLEKKGLIVVEDLKKVKEKVIIRAHGVSKQVYKEAQERNIELVDLTCINVLNIHKVVEEYERKQYFIFLIGNAEHPEIIGTYSFCGKNSFIISNENDVEKAIQEFKKTQIKKALVIAQTTYNLKKFENIIKLIEENISKDIELEIRNTICLSTEQRQKETEQISKSVEAMIIVGGKNSSNTNKLYEISCNNCKNVIFAETENDINLEQLQTFKTVGIMAGASTAQKTIDTIVKRLKENSENKITCNV